MASLQKIYSQEKLNGQVYTPIHIVNKILDEVGYNCKSVLGKTIIDPSCGDGRFLIEIAKRIISLSNKDNLKNNLEYIYGWDIDSYAINQCILNLNNLVADLGITVNWNISYQDALLYKSSNNLFNDDNNQKFDFVVGNPPYVRIQHLDKLTRQVIQSRFCFCKNGSTDLFIAFFELAYDLLKPNGIAGYISPNSFIRTTTSKPMRDFFTQQQSIVKIINYGTIQVFDDVSTYTAITIFNRKNNNNIKVEIADDINTFNKSTLQYTDLNKYPFWQLQPLPEKDGKKLKEIADIFTGIATLADKVYVSKIIEKHNNYTILENKIMGIIKIENGILRPVIKASKYKTHNQPITEYIIYPYDIINGNAVIMAEQKMKQKFPMAYEYLLSVKDVLDKRDAGKINNVAWYAYGRSQGLTKCFGKKIIFSPMSNKPNFVVCENETALIYSGYGMKYDFDLYELSKKISSPEMEQFVAQSSPDFRGGWKGYNKTIIQEFCVGE